jgi:hypothetical protein
MDLATWVDYQNSKIWSNLSITGQAPSVSSERVKELVYVRRLFNDLEDLQQATDVFDEIRDSPDFQIKLNSTSHAILARMRRCIAIDGRQVESYRCLLVSQIGSY